jgi:orotate phosphoribosyltransferase
MNNLKKRFIEFTLDHEILRFGNFTLNSGRESPYFFNTGLCCTGKLLNELSSFYCEAIIANNIEFDFIFGPAYKGITLSSSICLNLETQHNINKPYAFNRKETKSHGEKGVFVGYIPKGEALIVDDVISSGNSILNSIDLMASNNAKASSVLVAFDRMEVGKESRASSEISENYRLNIYSIINLDDILGYIKENESLKPFADLMQNYINNYKR